MSILTIMAFALPGRAAVNDAKTLYFIGVQTNWQLDDNYKFTAQSNTVYSLSLSTGILGEWLITDETGLDNWKLGMEGGSSMSVNQNYDRATFGSSSVNFYLQTVGSTEVSITLNEFGVENGASRVYVSGCAAPQNVYFAGAKNGWGLEDPNYHFTPVLTTATTTSRQYTLTINSDNTEIWEINDGTWGWNFGAGESQPVVNVDTSIEFNAGNFTTTWDGMATITFTYVKNSNSSGSAAKSSVLVEGNAFEFPENLYLIGNVKGEGWSGRNADKGLAAANVNGIYTWTGVEMENASGNYFRFTPQLGANSGDWGTCNRENYGAETGNKYAEADKSYDIGFSGNNWVADGGKYNITIDLNKKKMVIVAVDDAGKPGKLYAVGNVNTNDWNAEYPIAPTSVVDNVYRFENITVQNNGHDLGEFCFNTARSDDWDLVNMSMRYGPVNPKIDRVTAGTNTRIFMYAGSATGKTGNFMMAPGRYNIIVDLSDSDPEKWFITADLIEEGETFTVRPRNLYLIGHVNGYAWASDKGVTATVNNGVYTFSHVRIDPAKESKGYFTFTTMLSDDWDYVNSSPRFGAIRYNEDVEDGGVYTVYLNHDGGESSANSWCLEAGLYQIKVNMREFPIVMSVARTDLNHETFSYTEEWFSAEPYNWKDKDGNWHVSYLNEPATDTEQMKYFIAAIYGNRKIPGSKYVKYYDFSNPSDPIKTYSEYTPAWPGSSTNMYTHVRYNGIEGLENYGLPMYDQDNNLIDYTPDEHGLTALLVELNIPDEAAYLGDGVSNTYSTVHEWISTSYKQWQDETGETAKISAQDCNWMLDNLPSQFIKSISVLTERTLFDNKINPGYLFNVDKPLKHFFIVLKGHPRKRNWTDDMNQKFDIFNRFEQISPTTSNLSGQAQQPYSAIEQLRKGKKYQVIHDCSTVMYQDHFFCMDRQADGDYEAQENLYIYIPEARMTDWQWNEQYIIDATADPDVIIDPQAFGRDTWFADADINHQWTDKATSKSIGAFTNYNPKFAPYFFSYNLKLDINGFRPKIKTENGQEQSDSEHYQIDLSWKSNLAYVTGANDDDVKEEFMIYPLIDGMMGAPLKAADLYEFSVPEEDRAYTTITVAGAGDNVGALIVRTILPNVRVNLIYDYRTDEDIRTVEYVVTGCLADEGYVPVVSNDVKHTMDGSKLRLWAAINEDESKSAYNVSQNKNEYVNTVMLYHDDMSEEFMQKKHMKTGSAVYLMRKDVTDPSGKATPLVYFKFKEPENFGISSTPRFGASWVYYWTYNVMPGYSGSDIEVWYRGFEPDRDAGGNVIRDENGYALGKNIPMKATPESWSNTGAGFTNRSHFWLSLDSDGSPTIQTDEDEDEIVYPQDYRRNASTGECYNDFNNTMVYWEVRDKFDVSIEGNNHADRYTYYYVFDPDGTMFDVTTGGIGSTAVSHENATNEVNFVIPKSVIGTELALYDRFEIEADAYDRHLPANANLVNYKVANSGNIKAYKIYRKAMKDEAADAEVARTERNRDDRFEAFKVAGTTITSMGKVESFDATNSAIISLPVDLVDDKSGKDHDFYGVITLKNGRQYGVAPTKGLELPSLIIDNIKIYHINGDVNIPDNYRFCRKNLYPNLDIEGYTLDFAHYNIWRTIDSEHYANANTEELVFDHESPMFLNDDIMNNRGNINSFEHFMEIPLDDENKVAHYHQDCFEVSDMGNINGDYIVRVYARATKATPTSPDGPQHAPTQAMYVVTEARATAQYTGGVMTGVDNAVDSVLKVRVLSGHAIAINSNNDVAVFTSTGMKVAQLGAGNNQHVDLPSAGIYIVSSQGKSVKIAVK